MNTPPQPVSRLFAQADARRGRVAGPGNGLVPRPAGRPNDPLAPPGGFADGPHYRLMAAVDIQAFNEPNRSDYVQQLVRDDMYESLQATFDGSGAPWSRCYHEDRGDGVLIIPPLRTSPAGLIDVLAEHLRADLRRRNRTRSECATIRLRASVHVGQVSFDGRGVVGRAVSFLFRMLNADAFKQVFAESGADFALIASDSLYEDVIKDSPGLIDPDLYGRIMVRDKEARAGAWMYLPPVRHPALPAVSSRERPATSGRERSRPKAGKTRSAAAAPRQASAAADPPSAALPGPRLAAHEEPPPDDPSAPATVYVMEPHVHKADPSAATVGSQAAWGTLRQRHHPGERLRAASWPGPLP